MPRRPPSSSHPESSGRPPYRSADRGPCRSSTSCRKSPRATARSVSTRSSVRCWIGSFLGGRTVAWESRRSAVGSRQSAVSGKPLAVLHCLLPTADCPLLSAVVDGSGQFALQVLATDDAVDEAVLQQELAGLKALGQLDADGGLDGSRAGEADQRGARRKRRRPTRRSLPPRRPSSDWSTPR